MAEPVAGGRAVDQEAAHLSGGLRDCCGGRVVCPGAGVVVGMRLSPVLAAGSQRETLVFLSRSMAASVIRALLGKKPLETEPSLATVSLFLSGGISC